MPQNVRPPLAAFLNKEPPPRGDENKIYGGIVYETC